MTEQEGFEWIRAWAGAVFVGVVTVFFTIVTVPLSASMPLLVAGVVLLLVIAGWAWWAWRRGNRELAIGVAAGYGVLTLVSGGQCTLLVSGEADEAGLGVLTGFVGYPLFLVATLIIGGIASRFSDRDQKGDKT